MLTGAPIGVVMMHQVNDGRARELSSHMRGQCERNDNVRVKSEAVELEE